MKTLDDICTLITDGSHYSPEDVGEGYPMLSVKDMNDDCFDFSSCKHVGQDDFDKLVSNGCRPKVNDVVLAKDGSYLKTAFVIKEEQDIALLSSIAILRPNVKEISPYYLSYYLKSETVYRLVSLNYISGTALKRIILKGIKKIPVNLPELKEQEYRVALLDSLQKIIKDRKAELVLLDNLIKSRFVELFGDPVQNTKGWDTDICKNLTSKIGSGATPKGGRENYGTEGISFIRSMNVYNNRFEYKYLAYITDEQADKLSNVIIEENDVLLNITGASVARCCVVPKELIPARVNQHVAIVRCKGRLLSEFLCNMFTEDSYQRLLWSIATSGGATREAITKQQIEDLVLIVPPIELQEQFTDFVNQVDKLKSAVQKSVLELKGFNIVIAF